MNRAVGRVGEGLLRLTQLPHYKDSESFQDFKGFREESPFSLSSASFSFPSCPSPFPPGRVFLHHSCAYVDALRLTPRSLPFSACVRPVLLTPSAGAHSKCPLFSFLLLSLSNLFGTPQQHRFCLTIQGVWTTCAGRVTTFGRWKSQQDAAGWRAVQSNSLSAIRLTRWHLFGVHVKERYESLVDYCCADSDGTLPAAIQQKSLHGVRGDIGIKSFGI